MMRRWFIEDMGDHQKFLWDRDEPAVEWMISQVTSVTSVTRGQC
jgi:hypothetical protein